MTSILRQIPLPPASPPTSPQPTIESTSLITTLIYTIIHYVRLYGARALLLTILSLITVFRREMSSNRVYLTEEEEEKERTQRRRRRRRRRKTSLSHAPRNTTMTSESLSTNGNETKDQSHTDEHVHEHEEDYYEKADELLEHVGMEYTGFKQIFTVVLSVWAHILLTKIHEEEKQEEKNVKDDGGDCHHAREQTSNVVASEKEIYASSSTTRPSSLQNTATATTIKSENDLYLTTLIPPDAQVHIFTYLHPRDILTFSCISKSSHTLIHTEGCEENNISALLWKALWRRDYAWIVLEWNVGRRALQRSLSLLSSPDDNDYNNKREKRRLYRQGSSFSSTLLEKSSFFLYPPSLRSGESNSENDDEEEFEKGKGTNGVLQRLASVIDEKCSFSENDCDTNTDNGNSSIDSGNVELPPLPSFILSPDSNNYIPPPGNSHNENTDNQDQQHQQQNDMMTMKEFYLIFSQCWINYTLAGQNTYTNCLVGLHGHVFDITNFLEDHPGSPETLLIDGGGRDATKYFEDLGHSVSARKMANGKFCVVVDYACLQQQQQHSPRKEEEDDEEEDLMGDDSYHGESSKKRRNSTLSSPAAAAASWGLKRPTVKSTPSSSSNKAAENDMQLIPFTRSKPKRPGTLQSIKQKLQEEEEFELKCAEDWFDSSDRSNDGCIGNIHVFYDPFLGRWRSWYMNDEFEVVFI